MKSIKDNPVKIRRKFDQNFKREALQNWFNSGKSAEVIAGELGLNSNLLYAWKKRFALDGTGERAPAAAKPGSVADLQAQLDAAHRENRHLREQRDILKKRWVFSPNPRRALWTGPRDESPILNPGALPGIGRLAQRLLRLAPAPNLAGSTRLGEPNPGHADQATAQTGVDEINVGFSVLACFWSSYCSIITTI